MTSDSAAESDAATTLTAERVEVMATQLAGMATRPQFLDRLNAVRKVPLEQKMVAAVEAIGEIKREVEFPEGFRLTPRQFEMPQDDRPCIDVGDAVATIVHKGTIIVVIDTARAAADAYERPQPPEVVARAIHDGITKIGTFVCTPEFKALLAELYAEPAERRAAFVNDVILDRHARERRGIDDAAEGLIIQRSEFADGRPTLFCVTKMLGLAHPWQKVTITFDSKRVAVASGDGEGGGLG
jgi:hypothetical protein